jgi:hypothetical protein
LPIERGCANHLGESYHLLREVRISTLACSPSIIVGRSCHGLSKVSNDAIVVLCFARRFSPPVRGSTVVGIAPHCRRRTCSRKTQWHLAHQVQTPEQNLQTTTDPISHDLRGHAFNHSSEAEQQAPPVKTCACQLLLKHAHYLYNIT